MVVKKSQKNKKYTKNITQLEIYSLSTAGGKTETSTNIINLIELHFTDKYGSDVLSLVDF